MKNDTSMLRTLSPGTAAGTLAGLVFGGAMLAVGSLPAPAPGIALAALIITSMFGAAGGAVFQTLTRDQRTGGELLFWGLAYGALLWFVLPLTIAPLLATGSLRWDVRSAQDAFPSLVGFLVYGALTGLGLIAARRQAHADSMPLARGALLRGALAGFLAAALLGTLLDAQGRLLRFMAMAAESYLVAWLVTLSIGVLAGAGYAVLYPRPTSGAGPGLVRGMVYGFGWWIAGGLTLMSLVAGSGLAWSVEGARASFASLPGYLLFGAAIALCYTLVDATVRVLFSDSPPSRDEEGTGVRGLRALGRGALGGLIGGLLFTVIMVQIGFLPVVASLIGSTSTLAGLVVHLIIAELIGASYGLLFRRQSYDAGSALGWGVSYGMLWWILGPLTLLPLLLGTTPDWSVDVASRLMPSLVGHLLYGAGLGIIFYLLEARYSPWWIPLNQVGATRAARRKEQLQTSAPALWSLVVIIALTLPIVLGR